MRTARKRYEKIGRYTPPPRPIGRVPYGYRRVFDQYTGQFLGWRVIPLEVKIIRLLFFLREEGLKLYEIIDAVQLLGNSPNDKEWKPSTILGILNNYYTYRGLKSLPCILEGNT